MHGLILPPGSPGGLYFEGAMTSAKKSQLERFKEAARKLGTDDDEERFNDKLKKLAKQKPDDKKSSE